MQAADVFADLFAANKKQLFLCINSHAVYMLHYLRANRLTKGAATSFIMTH